MLACAGPILQPGRLYSPDLGSGGQTRPRCQKEEAIELKREFVGGGQRPQSPRGGMTRYWTSQQVSGKLRIMAASRPITDTGPLSVWSARFWKRRHFLPAICPHAAPPPWTLWLRCVGNSLWGRLAIAPRKGVGKLRATLADSCRVGPFVLPQSHNPKIFFGISLSMP